MATLNSIIFQQTITANGNGIHRDEAVSQVVLFWSITGAITGTSPTIQFTMQEVNPLDEVTPIGQQITSQTINSVSAGNMSLDLVNSPVILISWTVGGINPSFESVSLSTVAKMTANQIATVSAPQQQTKYDVGDTTIYIGTSASGTATSDAAWTIKKVILDANGNPTSTLWSSYIAIWDNRTSETYN